MQRGARENAAQFAAMRAELARSRDAVAVQFQTMVLALAIEKAGDPVLDAWSLAASLVQAAGADFLEQLAGMALGRPLLEHELLHHLHLLQAGASKSHIANQLFGAEESRRWRANRAPAAVLVQDVNLEAKETALGTEGNDYQKKMRQEVAIFEKRVNVHDLPAIFHYWSNKFLLPIVMEAGYKGVPDFFVASLFAFARESDAADLRFLSVGAGNCDLEISVAKELAARGCKNFVLECLEINPSMLARGRALAQECGLVPFMKFTEADFNSWKATSTYHGVMANQSLHHVTNLEHLFKQIRACLMADAPFAISDIIGRNGHQRWPESLAIVNRFWRELPESYKFNLLLNRHEEEYQNWDCSAEGFEGVRAQDVLPALLSEFHCHKFLGFGSAIDIFVERCFGHHFDPQREVDKAFIDRVHLEDERGLQQGDLTPTHMMAVFKVNPCLAPFYSRGIAPEKSVRVNSPSY
jgi:SAM-dependent methyltransferase